MPGIRREVIYPYPIDSVWKAISSREALSDWLMETDFEAIVGKRFTFKTKPSPGFDGIVRGEVLVVEPPHKLVYSWQSGTLKNTTVSFQLEEVKEGTKFTFEHTGFSGLRELIPRFILGSGWGSLLDKKIRAWLESQ
jgi:uncharacterized protein YndB with AHSA1/START domain